MLGNIQYTPLSSQCTGTYYPLSSAWSPSETRVEVHLSTNNPLHIDLSLLLSTTPDGICIPIETPKREWVSASRDGGLSSSICIRNRINTKAARSRSELKTAQLQCREDLE